MKTLPEIQKELTDRVSLYRSLQRLSFSDRLETVFSTLDESEKKLLIQHLLEGNKSFVDSFLTRHHEKLKSYEEKSLRELREIAKRLKIKNCTLYNKDVLVSNIISKAQNEKALSH